MVMKYKTFSGFLFFKNVITKKSVFVQVNLNEVFIEQFLLLFTKNYFLNMFSIEFIFIETENKICRKIKNRKNKNTIE